MTLPERVRRALERDALVPSGARVLVAVSGGSDSVALLDLLVGLAPECGFTVAGVAHLNHGLRGEESDGDEAFCRQRAAARGLRIEVAHRDVAALAREAQTSIEVAARRARYEFFEDVAGRLRADRIATGHTRDDQAETFLLRVLRGAGATGLAGIRPRRGPIVRPLLDLRRDELRAYLASRHQPFREDSSNRDQTIPRNWIRHRLIPLLTNHLNADIVEVLAREASVLRDETTLLDRLAHEAAAHIETAGHDRRLSLDSAALNALPAALARRVVRQALTRVDSGRFHGFDHVEQVLSLAQPVGDHLAADLPGVRVERNGAAVVLFKRGPRTRPADPHEFLYPLAVPGRVTVAETGCTIQALKKRVRSSQAAVKKELAAGKNVAALDAASIYGELSVRSRRAGDSVRPFGMKGRKKLQDVLVDAKVPREQRDSVPIVVDERDSILWVAGLVVSEDARVTERTQSMVILKLSGIVEEGDEA
ncbi:MAG: tRNA lysidine(34) synthetase TilS [Acidobacteria bacterium]|nr:tRNA lysidine(34) synthetase TilS [Acidobacteriota bacterium]